jgi:hypothetical protein
LNRITLADVPQTSSLFLVHRHFEIVPVASIPICEAVPQNSFVPYSFVVICTSNRVAKDAPVLIRLDHLMNET